MERLILLVSVLTIFFYETGKGSDDFSSFFDPTCNRGPPAGYDKCSGPLFTKRVDAWTYNKNSKSCEKTVACLAKMGLDNNLFLHERGCQVWCKFFKEIPAPIWRTAPRAFWDKYFL